MTQQDTTTQPAETGPGLVDALFQGFLGRAPTAREAADWGERAEATDAATLIRRFAQSPKVKANRGVHSWFAPGHYHSPVVDPETLGSYVSDLREDWESALEAIAVDHDGMIDLLTDKIDALNELNLPQDPGTSPRYAASTGPFPQGDAASLWLMMARHRPGRIIEIGSGLSTAAALDFAESLGLEGFRMTCIEPYADRLKSMMRPGDGDIIEIIERPVQEITPEIVGDLQPGDFFFIDSTHVMKTGSDVHHMFFHMLPHLPEGVILHVHDIGFPFEYPELWVTERNYSWNEAYALRAFLMFNPRFEVTFWASMLKRTDRALMDRSRHHGPNPGSSIWIRRVTG